MADTIIQRTPSRLQSPSVHFVREGFDNLIYQHGYRIHSEQAVRCPCSSDGQGANPSCQNCGGTGYFYINPRECRALITGINKDTKYTQWSPELIGTIAVSVDDSQKDIINFYNRLRFLDNISQFTEVLQLRETSNQKFVFTTYAPIDIEAIYIYAGESFPLILVDPTLYSISESNPYVIKINYGLTMENSSISILYRYHPEYHIIDIPHELRSSTKISVGGKLENIDLPIQGIARRSHLIIGDKPNYDGGGIIDNS